MTASVPSQLLIRLAQASPEQMDAIWRFLVKGESSELGAGSAERGGAEENEGNEGKCRDAQARFSFRRAGCVWAVVFAGSPVFHVPDTDGVKYLDFLLHHPNASLRAFDLEVAIKAERGEVRRPDGVQKAVDERARGEARAELVKFMAELEEAEGLGQLDKVRRLRAEIAEVRAVIGNDGLLAGDTGEKARDNVRKAIGKVMARLKRGGPSEHAFAQHIGQFLSLGYTVIYNQPEGEMWE